MGWERFKYLRTSANKYNCRSRVQEGEIVFFGLTIKVSIVTYIPVADS